MSTSDLEILDPSEEETEDLFGSPSAKEPTTPSRDPEASSTQRNGESKYDAEQTRNTALQKELEGVRNINEVIEGVLSSLETAKGNMDTVSRTVTSASTLLNTWTRILSQTEHNQRLILNPNWQGATQDMADVENEVVLKAQAAERRATEDERRREEARRRAEDEERQRQAGTPVARGTRSARSRGSGRGFGRGGMSGGINYVGVGGQPGVGRGSYQRGSSGTSRGTGGARGRGRGRGAS